MKKIRRLLILFVFFHLTSCDESNNTKTLEKAYFAIEEATSCDQKELELPFGFSFKMNKHDVQNKLTQMHRDSLIFNIEDFSFDYKYQEYSGVYAFVELFFEKDELARFVYQIYYKTEYDNKTGFGNSVSDWSVEYGKIIKELYNIKQHYSFYEPYLSKKENSGINRTVVSISSNKVVISKKGKDGRRTGTYFLIENGPISKSLPKYSYKQGKYQQEEIISRKAPKKSSSNYSSDFTECDGAIENSVWDGSVYQVKKYLKNNLKDPDSYEGISWSRVMQKGDSYYVTHKYRAKNSLGGFVIVEETFVLNSNGKILDIFK